MIEFYKNKRILVTGHTGFKGSWLSAVLLNFGAEMCGYSLKPEGNINFFNEMQLEKNMISEINDIRNLNSLKKTVCDFKPDIIFHMAAQPIVRASYDDPIGTYETNVMGTVNLLETIRYCDTVKSVLNITTDKVYENKELDRGYKENDNLCGYDPYSNSKSCSELVTYSYINSFFKSEDVPSISTARAGNVIGAGDFSKDRIIPDCVRAGIGNRCIEIRNPKSVRPYQYVLDCLYGYLLLAMKQYENKGMSGNYNFGPKYMDCITTEELTSNFCKAWGENLNYIIKNEVSVHEAKLLMLDSTKSRDILGWISQYDIYEAIKKTVLYYKMIGTVGFKNEINNHINEFFKGIR